MKTILFFLLLILYTISSAQSTLQKKDSVFNMGKWRRLPGKDSAWVNGKILPYTKLEFVDGEYRKKLPYDSIYVNGKPALRANHVYYKNEWRRKPGTDSIWLNGTVVYKYDYEYHNENYRYGYGYGQNYSSDDTYRRKPGRDSVWFNNQVVSKKYKDRLEYETYFMPGVGYSYYFFNKGDSLGNLSGFTIDYLLFAKSHQDDDFGPSHVKFYAKLNINNSDKEGINKLFMYSMGLQMSIEKNPKRCWLIPYFGIETGGISNKVLGTTFAFYPVTGFHAIATKSLYINIHGGYVYPIRNFDFMSGYFAQASLNFALW